MVTLAAALLLGICKTSRELPDIRRKACMEMGTTLRPFTCLRSVVRVNHLGLAWFVPCFQVSHATSRTLQQTSQGLGASRTRKAVSVANMHMCPCSPAAGVWVHGIHADQIPYVLHQLLWRFPALWGYPSHHHHACAGAFLQKRCLGVWRVQKWRCRGCRHLQLGVNQQASLVMASHAIMNPHLGQVLCHARCAA